jgi:hypothetical protein
MRLFLVLSGCLSLLVACDASSGRQAHGHSSAAPTRFSEKQLRSMADSIDAAVESFFAKFNVPVPPRADDAVFLRRAHLGITGQIPSAKEASDFLADANPNKRAALIDSLIDSPEASGFLFQQFAEIMHLQDEALGASQQRFLDWLRRCLRNNERYDALVRGMITAEGSLEENPAVGWLLGGEGSVMPVTMDLCNVWLGYNIQCAACHDSPYNDATQMEFYRLAANFSALRTVVRMPDGKVQFVSASRPPPPSATLAIKEDGLLRLRLPKHYLYRDGQPGDVVAPRLPQLHRTNRNSIQRLVSPPRRVESRPPLPAPRNMRETLAQWVTVDNEPRFSHVIASRLWIQMLGDSRGSFALNAEDLQEPIPMPSLNAMMPLLDFGNPSYAWGTRCHTGRSSYIYTMSAAGSPSFSIDTDDLDHPILGVLSAAMRDVAYDLREFQRVIWNTRAAQREATPDSFGVVTQTKYVMAAGWQASPLMRRMRAEQIWDALISLAGPNTSEKPSCDLPLVLEESHPLRVLGRSARGWSDADRAPLSPTIARWMMHSPLVLAVASPGSRVIQEMQATSDTDARIRQAFLAILSRNPTPRELERATEIYNSGEMDTASADSLLVGALLNTSEFLFLH